jgi:8-oxo-dGTP pyrophosphatase MutT (NUDIX family)
MSFTEFPDVSEKFATIATASDLPTKLSALVNDPLECPSLHTARRMSPQLSYGRHSGPAPATARAAAVMLLLFQRGRRWHVPITKRPAALTRHGGQISLPGGRIEPGETSSSAAQRELIEELGVGHSMTQLGQLPERYVYASDYVVTPHVAWVDAAPSWIPDAREVERVVELPLEVLFSPACLGQMVIRRGPLSFSTPCFAYGSDRIWGVTAVILAELADSLCRAFDTSQRSN